MISEESGDLPQRECVRVRVCVCVCVYVISPLVLRVKKGSSRGEGPAHRDEEWPPLATTRESPRTEAKTQHSQK